MPTILYLASQSRTDGGAAGLLNRCVREVQWNDRIAGLDGDPQAACHPLANAHPEELQPCGRVV